MRAIRRCSFKLQKEGLADGKDSSGMVLNLIFQQKGRALNFFSSIGGMVWRHKTICQPKLLMMLPPGRQSLFEGRCYPGKRGTFCHS